MSREYDKFNLVTSSIREHLITAPEWLEQVRSVEYVNIVDLMSGHGIENGLKNDNMLMLPYPYKEPLWLSYFREETGGDPSKLQQEQIALVLRGVVKRVTGFLDNIYDETFINEIDNNYNFGAILHQVSGIIFGFDYEAVDRIDVTTIPVQHLYSLLQRSTSAKKTLGPEYETSLYVTLANADKYMIYYQMHYREGYKDIFTNATTRYGSMSIMSPLTLEESVNIITQLNYSYKSHVKCILTV